MFIPNVMWPTTVAVSTWRSSHHHLFLACVPFNFLLSASGPGFGASRLFACVWIRHNNMSPICVVLSAIFLLRGVYVSWRKSRYTFDLVWCNVMRFPAYWTCCLQQFAFRRQALAPRFEEGTRLALSYVLIIRTFLRHFTRNRSLLW